VYNDLTELESKLYIFYTGKLQSRP